MKFHGNAAQPQDPCLRPPAGLEGTYRIMQVIGDYSWSIKISQAASGWRKFHAPYP
jgi:hypothetical protein